MASKITRKVKDCIKKTRLFKRYLLYLNKKAYQLGPEYRKAATLIQESKMMVDLGCGSNPHPHAKVAVDKYIEPIHRKFGNNQNIDIAEMEKNGIKFVQADFENLPFTDNQFDFAYSHHVIEHLDDPSKACLEMQRIARGGVIYCPSILSEYIFGRKYHKWLVTYRGQLLIFIEKDWDQPWFGEGPVRVNGKIKTTKDCNPFDILLNEGNWYHGIHRYKRLTQMLRGYWFGHTKNLETCFIWKDKFDYLIIYKDGSVKSSLINCNFDQKEV